MRKSRSLPFIGVRMHKNRTPTGRRTSTPAKRAALYFAYGMDKEAQQTEQQRGLWLGPGGQAHSHEQVMGWAKQAALDHHYTFEAILSVPEAQLTGEQFSQAMQQGQAIDDWRLVAHHDTEYAHAHVLFFRDKRLKKETFLAWQSEIRAELVLLEEQQLKNRSAQQETGLEMAQSQEPEQSYDQGMGFGW